MQRIALFFLLLIGFASCGRQQKGNLQYSLALDSITYLHKSIEFIWDIKRSTLKDSTFILVDEPFNVQSYGGWKKVIEDTTTFSKEELRGLTALPTLRKWTKQIWPDIKLINSSTFDSIFSDKTNGWGYYNKTIGSQVNSFSYPIFIRNYTYCIFYYDHSCGRLCGDGGLGLYKYQNNRWVLVKYYVTWIS